MGGVQGTNSTAALFDPKMWTDADSYDGVVKAHEREAKARGEVRKQVVFVSSQAKDADVTGPPGEHQST